jgi:myosin-1
MALSKEDKVHFELKILAESLFKGKKKSYAKSLSPRFRVDRLGEEHKALRQSFISNILPSGESIKVKLIFMRKCNNISLHFVILNYAFKLT